MELLTDWIQSMQDFSNIQRIILFYFLRNPLNQYKITVFLFLKKNIN